MNILSLFDGISCGQIALQRAGVKVDKYFACEIDKHALNVAQVNYPNTVQLGDVCSVDLNKLPKIGMLCAGSPCQGFSSAGKQLNFNDPRSKLFFEFVRILGELRKVNPDIKFLLENVRMKKEWLDVITLHLGVEPIKINSALVSAQNRVRYYWTNIKGVTQPQDKGIDLAKVLQCPSPTFKKHDFLSPIHSSQFFFGAALRTHPRQPNGLKRKKRLEFRKDDKSNCITTHPLDSLFALGDGQYRKFLPIEVERLQTVPEGYTEALSDTQRHKCLGNGWTVDVIYFFFS